MLMKISVLWEYEEQNLAHTENTQNVCSISAKLSVGI